MLAAELWNTSETHDIKSSLIVSNILGCGNLKTANMKVIFSFLNILKGQFTDLQFTVYRLQICFNTVQVVFMLFLWCTSATNFSIKISL